MVLVDGHTYATQLELKALDKIPKVPSTKWGDEQKYWLWVHLGISAMVHATVVLIIIGLHDNGERTEKVADDKAEAKAKVAKEEKAKRVLRREKEKDDAAKKKLTAPL